MAGVVLAFLVKPVDAVVDNQVVVMPEVRAQHIGGKTGLPPGSRLCTVYRTPFRLLFKVDEYCEKSYSLKAWTGR